jgi:hypothetical protein
MRYRATRMVCALGLALLAAGWSQPPADDAARVAVFDPLARFTWSTLACAPVVHTGPEALAIVGEASAISDPLTCEVWVRPGLTAYGFCVTLAHEYGHLSGYVGDAADDPLHSADPHALMHATPPSDWEPCVALALPPLETAVAARARRSLHGGGWRIRLIRTRQGRRLVIASRGARRVVWQVWGTRAAWGMARER